MVPHEARYGATADRTTPEPGEFEAATHRYISVTNEVSRPFVWTKTTDEILASVARFRHPDLRDGTSADP